MATMPESRTEDCTCTMVRLWNCPAHGDLKRGIAKRCWDCNGWGYHITPGCCGDHIECRAECAIEDQVKCESCEGTGKR